MFRKKLQDDSGQVMILTILSMTLLFACLALAVDVGTLFNAKRKVQIAADAGAIAGALEGAYGSGGATTKAIAAAKANLATTPTPTSNCPSATTGNAPNICVNTNPTAGYHTGSAFLEVTVLQPSPTYFMHLFMPSTINVAARAVAGTVGSPACMYLLDPTASGALSLQGSGTITATNCGIDVNSDSQQAVCLTGGAASVKSPFVRFRASKITTQGPCNKTLSTTVYTGDTYINDPLGGLTGPTVPSGCQGGTASSATTITSGNVGTVGGASGQTICFSSPVTISGTVSLPAAMYVFQQGVTIATGASVTVPAGTFEIAGGSLKESGGQSCLGNKTTTGFIQQSNSTFNITAPTTGTYKGIALMEPTGVTTPLELQFGSNSGNYGSGQDSGLIYAPSAPVYLHDNGGGVTATGLISDTVTVCSSSLTINSYNYAAGNASPLNQVSLVE